MYYTNAGLPFIKDEFHLECKSFKELSNNLSEISPFTFIPAWSLHILLSMLPDDPNLFWTLNNANISIEQEDGSDFFQHRNSMYDSIIDCIVFLIKEKWFNKDYLEE